MYIHFCKTKICSLQKYQFFSSFTIQHYYFGCHCVSARLCVYIRQSLKRQQSVEQKSKIVRDHHLLW